MHSKYFQKKIFNYLLPHSIFIFNICSHTCYYTKSLEKKNYCILAHKCDSGAKQIAFKITISSLNFYLLSAHITFTIISTSNLE